MIQVTESMISELVLRGSDDWVYAAEAVSIIRSLDAGGSEENEMQAAIKLITAVLERGLMEAGDIGQEGFRTWQMSTQESIQQIRNSMESLNRLPDIGEICWLSNTPAGDSLAAQVEDP